MSPMDTENGQHMGLGVEYELIKGQKVAVITEEQEEILERLSQEEALHLVPVVWVSRVLDVVDGGVPDGEAGVLLKGLEDAPPPLPVCLVARQTVQVHQTLHRLWPQQVVGVSSLSTHDVT